MRIRLTFVLLFISASLLTSCIIVKEEGTPPPARTSALSPKPTIAMSHEIVHSESGDMVARLPKDWFFVDVEDKVSSNVIAVASSPEYTLSLVFSAFRKNESLDEMFAKEGLLGLARTGLHKHERKSAGTIKRQGSMDVVEIGTREFGLYEFSNDNGATFALAGVFKSSLDNYYELALVQMPASNKKLPTRDAMNEIFAAVLATVVY